MRFEITGKIHAKFDAVQRSETFRVREFVIEVSEENNGRSFVSYIKFQSVNDRITIIDTVNIGDMVKVYFNIKGSRWEKNGTVNYITNLDAWKIENLAAVKSANTSASPNVDFSAPEEDDIMPF